MFSVIYLVTTPTCPPRRHPQGWQSFVQRLPNSTYLHSRPSDLTLLFFRWITFILNDGKLNVVWGVYSTAWSFFLDNKIVRILQI